MIRTIGVSAILGFVTLGCGPEGHGESSSEASDVGGTSTGGASSSTTTASEPTSSSTSSSTTDEPEPEPAPACGPPPEGATLDITLDGEVPFTLGDVRFDQACEVAEVEDDGAGGYALGFDCTDEMGQPVVHTLALTLEPPGVAPVTVGEAVQLRLHNDNPFYANTFLTVRDAEGAPLLALLSAEALPDAYTDEYWSEYYPQSDFYAPLVFDRVWPCEPSCESGPDSCPCRQRGAVDFTLGDEVVRVYESNLGQLAAGQFELRVPRSGAVYWQSCPMPTDTTSAWTTLLVTRQP
ncbi:hypothetical protein OV090_38785 [Nannocystis sp. RBIL2]|uniref:hypothetical protein n=1 Tax=Nannocystis sp. RBIL2 TaxID=2996788 RepID=UPI00226E5B0B|nr:hypothetical protein [Nannocystis sp. RBIL2]MCY1070752.1 hypothetical protein [Nannocystis sp. RBIL2]